MTSGFPTVVPAPKPAFDTTRHSNMLSATPDTGVFGKSS